MTTMMVPQQWMMVQHLEWLVQSAGAPHRIEIAWGLPDRGPTHARTFDVEEIWPASYQAVVANSEGNNVYVGMTLKRDRWPYNGRTRADQASLATCLVLDFDHDARAGIKRIDALLRTALLVVTGTKPELRIQVGIHLVHTTDLPRWDRLLKAAAQFSGADVNAVGVNRLVRIAGAISYPSAAKQARGYLPEQTLFFKRAYRRYTLDELEQAIPTLPRAADKRPSNNEPRQGASATLGNVANIMSALQALPLHFAEEYRPWLEVGFALHDFDRGRVGLALWKKFSARCQSLADKTDFDRLWAKFDSRRDGPKIGIASLLHHARAAGWRAPHQWERPSTVLA